jgi:hypothetical protein
MHNIARAIVFVSALCLTLAACGSTATPSVVAPSAVTPSVALVSAAPAIAPSVTSSIAPSAASSIAPSAASSIAPSAASSGGITFDPATESCSNPVAQTVTITLPSSLNAGTEIIFYKDGIRGGGGTVVQMFGTQAEGSWVTGGTAQTASLLQALCVGGAAVGTHTWQVLDYANNKVIVEGSYTVTK